MEIDYDFDGSLRLADVLEDFFYSPSTGLFVFRHPPTVDARLRRAADELGIALKASPEKWMVDLPLADALRLLRHLGSSAMSLPDYFAVRRDAIAAGDRAMLASLESDLFIEMLATVFVRDRAMIHQPEVHGRLAFSGTEIPVRTPEGRYGWIHPDDVDPATGLPTVVTRVRNVEDATIKYWDTHTDIGREGLLMAVRGFVTSVGKISLDLGFPGDAFSPKMTLRECRTSRPEGVLDERVLAEAREVLAPYYAAARDKSLYSAPSPWYRELLAFLERRREALLSSHDLAAEILKEDVRDALGSLWRLAPTPDGAAELKRAAQALSGLSDEDASDARFRDFLLSRRDELARAVRGHESIVFVMGHDNPDTDTVVSSMVEAFRQHLLRGGESVFLPVIPGSRMPEEAAELLGPELSGALLFAGEQEYVEAARSGRPEWIMVDRNVGREQPDTRAIIDHHYPSDVCLRQQIPRRILFAGSTCALVALRFYGLGAEIPEGMARLLHGGTLMDTENRTPGKMTPLDVLVMDQLKAAAGTAGESAFYRGLMRQLVSCSDPDQLFVRDYKEDWGFFGFAVAKSIGILAPDRATSLERLEVLAQENNRETHLPLTLLKIVDYDDNAETIRRERMVPVFAPGASPDFQESVRQAITTIIRHESPSHVQIEERGGAIDYWGVGTQLSRKKLAPVLDPVVAAFNRYFPSPSSGLHFRRDFLRDGEELRDASRRAGVRPHVDPDGFVVGNPAELKLLLQEMGLLAASAAEYFKAYFDAIAVNDTQMVAHLTSPRYLETLDVIVEDRQVLVEHPRIVRTGGGYGYEGGTRRRVTVPVGEPGLIDPRRVDPDTGLPTVVEDPQQYGTGLWRYWSPDSDRAWALRSTIFAYGIPSLDLKFGFAEALPRLTIRPCLRAVTHPRVRVFARGGKIVVDVQEAR